MKRALFCLALVNLSLIAPSHAQTVTPDGTLSTIVNTPNTRDFTITGGRTAGTNLFHSFQEFSVPTGGSARFNNALDIQTIFSRVTGGTTSQIDGLLQTNGRASLFLLNPNGILFGSNASLNIGGSFVGTTASSVKFADGTEFSAVNPGSPPLLTISAPIGLQMGQNPGAIVSQAFSPVVNPGQTLAFIGGDLLLRDSYLNVPDGHIELGSVGSDQFVSLVPNGSGWRFDYAGVTAFQNILLQSSYLDVSGNGGGTIQLQGGQIQLTNGSQAYTATAGAISGGGITVNAQDSLLITRVDSTGTLISALATIVAPGATGNTGNISVHTPTLKLSDGGVIASVGSGDGNVGHIAIQADQVELRGTDPDENSTSIYTFAGSQGRGGNITIDAQRVALLNGAQVTALTNSAGDAGDVTVRATTIQGVAASTDLARTGFESVVLQDATGNGGKLTLETQQLSLNGAYALSGTFGSGDAGSLLVQAKDITIDGRGTVSGAVAGLLTNSFSGATGNAGNLSVETDSLTLLNGAKVSASLAGTGTSGNVAIRARTIEMRGDYASRQFSLIGASVADTGVGNGGAVSIVTDRLNLDGGQIVAGTFGTGNAGSVTIRATDILATGATEDGATPSGIFTVVTPTAKGNAGLLDIQTDRLQLRQGAEISSATFGVGNAGRISVQASDFVQIDGVGLLGNSISNISSNVAGVAIGEGGSIAVQTGQLQLTNGGQLSVSTAGRGNAGNITAQVGTLLVQGTTPNGSPSSLSATSTSNSAAGSINIRANRVRVSKDATVTVTSSAAGDAGDLMVKADEVQVTDGGSLQAEVRDGTSGMIGIVANSLTLDRGKISTASSRQGSAGNVNIEAEQIALNNESQITSRSRGTGNGGMVSVSGERLSLSDRSSINATTTSSNGGNISLSLSKLLLLRNNSQLTAEAGGTGNGGNIAIAAPIILGLENSDIIANAFQGRGGNIDITTQSIFGLQFRPQLTPDNDISASSQFGVNGTVQITTLGVDPNSGLINLPTDVVDSSQQIATGCAGIQDSSFIISGRGGLPTNPSEEFWGDLTWSDLRDLPRSNKTEAPVTQASSPVLLEATGWRRNAVTGAIELIAAQPMSRGSGVTCAIAP
ncbi:two-partner secretion domain-containing protein [Leptolyngbya sp. NIES-2104]|uniref:two-partner secretion domain-containing protein n=1 Tax=Leptolyngbya sp. NIES-2104 TaxID=1552121 RepID=UPI0006EC96D7|nr:filamentous hemagglutinin N-terminal domain-containing protein [Leptolyngbya sp. NIES-2104]GAP98073.1 putative hemagglutinin-related protein [Leptolyngbya sp. NIES-2104]